MPTRGGKSEQITRPFSSVFAALRRQKAQPKNLPGRAEISQISQHTARQDFKHPDDPQYGDNVNDVMTSRRQSLKTFEKTMNQKMRDGDQARI
jgi:hypothetical protein